MNLSSEWTLLFIGISCFVIWGILLYIDELWCRAIRNQPDFPSVKKRVVLMRVGFIILSFLTSMVMAGIGIATLSKAIPVLLGY